MAQKRSPKGGEAHVRLYRHELECPAYRSLCPEARALLTEFRALFNGRENLIYMSIREAQKRLGVGRHRVEQAMEQLLDRGFIRLIESGSFNRKVRHATAYALTNEPLTNRDGDVAPKDFMRWRPPDQKNTVLMTSTDGADSQHRDTRSGPENSPHGVDSQHREPPFSHTLGADDQHTDKLPGDVS